MLALIKLDGRGRARRAIDARRRRRDVMRKNNHKDRHKDWRKAGAGSNTGAAPPVCTADHRKTLSDGLRILARIIARAHLERQVERSGAPAPGPPAADESRD